VDPELRADAVQAALQLVLESRPLSRCGQLRNLLEYLVQNTLEGRTERLNELAIAENVLGRMQGFTSLEDSCARKAMSRLRRRLGAYYAGEGASAEIRFEIRKYKVELTAALRINPVSSRT
jgi:hypothetical protein